MGDWGDHQRTTNVIAADDPVTCTIYARENNPLDVPGWKRFKPIAKREKKFIRMENQAKIMAFRTARKYKYGFEVPRDYAHTSQMDAKNGKTRWQDTAKTELDQIKGQEV